MIEELRKDFDENGLSNFGVNDVAYLFNRLAELEALLKKTAEDGATVGWMIAEDRLRKRIAKLEQIIDALTNLLATKSDELEAALRRQGGE